MSAEANDQLEFLKLIANRLGSAGIPYMLTGSVAMSMYAQPRMTRDIDIVVEFEELRSRKIVELFEDIAIVDESEVREAARSRSMFNMIHREWVIKADLIARRHGEFAEMEFSRRRSIDVDGTAICVASPEDLLLSKLSWGATSESEMQVRDARNLVASIAHLDWSYLTEWAIRLGISDLLEKARTT